jgi:phosphoribosylanthranilate isomerase
VTHLKFCGLTRPEDARLGAALGAWALGVVLWPQSPRGITAAQAAAVFAGVPGGVERVGVFVRPTLEEVRSAIEAAGLTVVQVHGIDDLTPFIALGRPLVQAARLEAGEVRPAPHHDATLLLDAHDPVRQGGTGRTIEWSAAADVSATRRVLLAGGLTPANVATAIAIVRPWGVDVASGVETSPGLKDHERMRRFAEAVRASATGTGQRT